MLAPISCSSLPHQFKITHSTAVSIFTGSIVFQLMNLHHPRNLFFRRMKTRPRMMSSPSMHMGSNRKRPPRRNLGVWRKAQMSRCKRPRKRRRLTPWSMKQKWYAPFLTGVILKWNMSISSQTFGHTSFFFLSLCLLHNCMYFAHIGCFQYLSAL